MKILSLLLLSVIFVSCGKSINSFLPESEAQAAEVESAVSENYEYGFRTRSCQTGTHAARTHTEICTMLSDEELNDNCAKEEREVLFENSSCSGEF